MKHLTEHELFELTDETEPEKQYEFLKEHGVKLLYFGDGPLKVSHKKIFDSMIIKDYEPTALYRHWSGEDLLYVGISSNPFKRTGEHNRSRNQAIAMRIDRITIEWHPTRREALEAEKSAIQDEKPVLNKDHNR